MTAQPTQHPWSSEALFNKALLYVQEMERYKADDWRFGFWSSLSLELLARASLAHISPALLANGRDWRNIYYGLGHAPTAKSSPPISLDTSQILKILSELLPEFTKELHDSCATHLARRNAELHTAEDAFVGLSTSEWLPKFYATCDVLLRSIGKDLANFFTDPNIGKDMIAALMDSAAKAVRKDIEAHKLVWEGKSPDDQKGAIAQATAWATRQAGHRVDCPACGSPALIHGTGSGPVTTEVSEDIIEQRQAMLPSSFECIACGLKIAGLSKLSACGLGDVFYSTSTLSPAQYFGLYTDEELDEARAKAVASIFEEDMNEY